MKILTKKEVITSLCIGATLGIFVALFLITYLIRQGSLAQHSPLNPIDLTSAHPITYPFYDQAQKVISIPMEIHRSKQEKNTANYEMINVRVSFYTGLARENGGYTELNAIGGPLKIGSLAAPKDVPFGSHFIIKNLPGDVQTDKFIVDDRGSAITWMNNHTMKVDVYVKRKPGESDTAYFRRTNDLGIIYTTALYKTPK